MNIKSRVLKVVLVASVIGGIIGVILASVTAVILVGGRVLTWLLPAISMEFASLMTCSSEEGWDTIVRRLES
jgi:hypothetical protein